MTRKILSAVLDTLLLPVALFLLVFFGSPLTHRETVPFLNVYLWSFIIAAVLSIVVAWIDVFKLEKPNYLKWLFWSPWILFCGLLIPFLSIPGS